MMMKLISIAIALIAVGLGLFLTHKLCYVPEMPELDQNKWWGSGPRPTQEDTEIRPFKIEFSDTMIKDLRERLTNRRPLTKPLEGIQSEYGINTDYLETILEYWANEYDFKKRAELLNEFDHYKTRIQGLDLHFIRSKPKDAKGKKVLPLLMLHGWPSSSKEFVKVIPLLNAPREGFDFVFDVVAADLPGFGFSEGTNKRGLSPVQMGIMMRQLMRRLGIKQFYVQAGDWGSQCATHMATMYPGEVLGFHTNMPISSMPISVAKVLAGSLFPSLAVDDRYRDRIYPLAELSKYIMRESGYFHIQATKPDTISVALTDSPTGLAAWIVEKMAVCTDRDSLHLPHGGLSGLPLPDVLDTVTIAWAERRAATSARVYAEGISTVATDVHTLHKIPTPVPTAAINFKYEVVYQPDWVLRDKFPNLVHSTTLDFGGHFAALQTPDVLVQDVFEATVEFLKFHSKKK
ncbi:juvenile hormone epoxide hydrolase isoform X1 [Plutella xylostella]|uniref:juvenile hormone epoxide hydrolase isoform X1 n=2 Tax=Plutella xylostella TaxID=51655 RepID=UPI002032C1B1|nr:juvenile hormone epoxide hydrolase isoform X1 [Plutella xylostella]